MRIFSFFLIWIGLILLVSTCAIAVAQTRNGAANPVCMSGGVRVDCSTNEPITVVDTEEPEVMTNAQATRASRGLNPNDPPLSLRTMTIEEFNDTRVRGLNQNVTRLLREAMDHARRPFHPGRNESLTNEIEARLDPMADTARPDRDRTCSNPAVRDNQIDYYWLIFLEDRTRVFVKPMCNLHILTYTLLYNPPNG